MTLKVKFNQIMKWANLSNTIFQISPNLIFRNRNPIYKNQILKTIYGWIIQFPLKFQ